MSRAVDILPPGACAAEDLALCLAGAREAGRIALDYFGKAPEVWYKGGTSPVSEADYAVDAHLKAYFGAERPTYGWVSEESADAGMEGIGPDEDDAHRSFFIVDPIDGTRAYLRGESTWCVSIALVRGGRPVAGVIHAPLREETYTVTRGGGAFLNDAPITVSAREAGGGAPLTVAMPDSFHAAFRRMAREAEPAIAAEKGAPSLAYRLALVACGRLDATLIRPNAADWDIAAGDLLIECAGGRLVDGRGEEILYSRERNRHGLLVAASGQALAPARRLAQVLGR